MDWSPVLVCAPVADPSSEIVAWNVGRSKLLCSLAVASGLTPITLDPLRAPFSVGGKPCAAPCAASTAPADCAPAMLARLIGHHTAGRLWLLERDDGGLAVEQEVVWQAWKLCKGRLARAHSRRGDWTDWENQFEAAGLWCFWRAGMACRGPG